jgi:hypothetical protein
MKKNNPQTPIMIREAAGTLPKIYARYGKLRLFKKERDIPQFTSHAD